MTNRPIKFRVWVPDVSHYWTNQPELFKNVMVEPYRLDIQDDNIEFLLGQTETGKSLASMPLNLVSLMQYTGLKDKNGVEIYEGDVVQSGTLRGVIEFNHGTFGLRTSLSTWYGVGTLEDCEVIGNIYENPDLKPD